MNSSFTNNRDWELYNFDNMGGTTEYDDLLINKDIDNYFNNLINKSIPNQNPNIIKSNYTFEKFYFDYIEHNLIFIVVLIGIVIFLVIRYYIKDFDSFDSNNELYQEDNKLNQEDKSNEQNQEKIKNIKKNKLIDEKLKLIKYKKELDREKQKILSIIDELSNINEYSNISTRQDSNSLYTTDDINMNYSNNYIKEMRHLNHQNQQYQQYQQNQQNHAFQPYQSEIIAHNFDNDSQFYDIGNFQSDKTNEIDGLYIEPPFN